MYGTALAVEGKFLSILFFYSISYLFSRSYAAYGKIGFDRRFRIYDISDYGETIRTYKRTEHDEIVDDMILSGRGAPPPYEGPA